MSSLAFQTSKFTPIEVRKTSSLRADLPPPGDECDLSRTSCSASNLTNSLVNSDWAIVSLIRQLLESLDHPREHLLFLLSTLDQICFLRRIINPLKEFLHFCRTNSHYILLLFHVDSDSRHCPGGVSKTKR